MTSPIFSIVIPAYNEEKIIAKCLEAVCRQDFSKPYEVILVDNNSSDETVKIVSNFDIKIISEPKQGYVHALIRGFSEAKGIYIALTDADTVVPVDWLTNIHKAYLSDNDVVAVGGGATLFPKKGYAQIANFLLNLSGVLFKIISGFNFSVNKQVYDRLGGFRSDLNFNTDTELGFRLVKVGKLIFLANNKVLTSSRRYLRASGLVYSLKGILNVLCLRLFKRTLFFAFGDVRED